MSSQFSWKVIIKGIPDGDLLNSAYDIIQKAAMDTETEMKDFFCINGMDDRVTTIPIGEEDADCHYLPTVGIAFGLNADIISQMFEDSYRTFLRGCNIKNDSSFEIYYYGPDSCHNVWSTLCNALGGCSYVISGGEEEEEYDEDGWNEDDEDEEYDEDEY